MTDDIVTRLRKQRTNGVLCNEAADEIENLRKAIWEIADLARKHYKTGILWGAINHAVDVADEHYKNCDCGERY